MKSKKGTKAHPVLILFSIVWGDRYIITPSEFFVKKWTLYPAMEVCTIWNDMTWYDMIQYDLKWYDMI